MKACGAEVLEREFVIDHDPPAPDNERVLRIMLDDELVYQTNVQGLKISESGRFAGNGEVIPTETSIIAVTGTCPRCDGSAF